MTTRSIRQPTIHFIWRRCDDCGLFLRHEPDYLEHGVDAEYNEDGFIEKTGWVIEHRVCESCGSDNEE